MSINYLAMRMYLVPTRTAGDVSSEFITHYHALYAMYSCTNSFIMNLAD